MSYTPYGHPKPLAMLTTTPGLAAAAAAAAAARLSTEVSGAANRSACQLQWLFEDSYSAQCTNCELQKNHYVCNYRFCRLPNSYGNVRTPYSNTYQSHTPTARP